ncbi:winged helix-turn-helix domain-containing protein [Thalassomonas haliotis]|uniref:Winged helix-turn-helix domain-containing protein n=2 Tax=Thalassomonas haliotis TaxID=485448 RepID=A0ABY7VP83_9GAMM|nr:winged helix-turn-helix domain-containing protein [Thalassomonas haliotis]
MPAKKVLLVQADRQFSRVVAEMLTFEGFEVLQEFHGDNVQYQVSHYQPDLVILDVLLPGHCGLALCRELRREYNGQLLFLSSKASDIDQVLGLEVGADAYVVKPVALRVLLAKIKAMFRWQYQQQTAMPAQEVCCGELTLCRTSRQVHLYRQALELTGQEFDLLWLLASRAGEVQDRNVIYQLVAGRDYDGLDRSIDVRVSRLRKKLHDDLKRPFRIKTVRGQGYLLVPDAWN